MEVVEESKFFNEAIPPEEWTKIPSDTRKKLDEFVESKYEELFTAKALYETKKAENEEKLKQIQLELNGTKSDHETSENQLETAHKTIAELEAQLTTFTAEITQQQELCNRLESSTAEFRRQRDLAIDERDAISKMLERRNTEIDRLQADMKSLSQQLHSAINAKCEALAKSEEVLAMKSNLEFRERHMENETTFLNNHIKNLTEDLNNRAAELQNLRHEHTSNSILLETKLTRKTEELTNANENIAMLQKNNKSLNHQIQELTEKLKKQRDFESSLEESFNNEVVSQKRLAELYKGMHEESKKNIEHLQEAITDLQESVRTVTDQYCDLEAKHKEAEVEYEDILNKKNECIVLLKSELDTARDMIKHSKEESLHREIEHLSPSASSGRIFKSSTSLTHIYSQLLEAKEELAQKKDENRKLNNYLGKVMLEHEHKSPQMDKLKEDYEIAMETIAELSKNDEKLLYELQKARDELIEARKLEARAMRENERMKKEITDLSRQVCLLLKDVEASRNGSMLNNTDPEQSLSENATAEEIISKKLVTFNDIQELQSNNQKLLALVRELTKKQEEMEGIDMAGILALKEKINTMRDSQQQLLIEQENQNRMLENVIRQRDMYRSLCSKSKLPDDADFPMDQSSNTESDTVNTSTKTPDQDKKIKELEDKLAEVNKELTMLKDEYDTYKKDKCANEKILVEQVEKLKNDSRECTNQNFKLSSIQEYNDERFKLLKVNMDRYKEQIKMLEEKNKNDNNIINKHELTIRHLTDETLKAQSNQSRAEVAVQNLQQECRLLRDSESRLLKEKELANRGAAGQSVLLKNLELIKASIERSEAEGKLRLETTLDETTRECSALRRRLQEEQDKFRELSKHLQQQTDQATDRMKEEMEQNAHLREELAKTRDELNLKTQKIEELSMRIKNSIMLSRTETEDQRTKELEAQLMEAREEIESLQQQLALSKDAVTHYCSIAEVAEEQAKQHHQNLVQLKESTDSIIAANNKTIADLQEKLSELETELSLQSNGQAETTIELKNQLRSVQEQLDLTGKELEETKLELNALRSELRTMTESVQMTEDKYTREMMLHSTDLQSLANLKEDYTRVSNELNEIKSERDCALEKYDVCQKSWGERFERIEKEKDEISERLKFSSEQNSCLHDQIQALSTQLSCLHAQKSDTSINQSLGDSSFNRSLPVEDDAKSEQLLQIIKYIRKEKDIAVTKCDILQAENLRLKSQFEIIDTELKDTKNALNKERAESETSMVTAAKHEAVLRKVETLNAITDSNKILRDERDSLKSQVRELTERLSGLEEQIAPLQEKNQELLVRIDSSQSEIQALRLEATRWRQRANALTEKANKISPDDWRRLQNEREKLAKMLSGEKEAHRRVADENNNLKQEKSKLEDQLNNLAIQNRNQAKELKRLNDELNNFKVQVQRLNQEAAEAKDIAAQRTDENTKITEDLATKDVLLTDARAKEMQVRKIAKRYKTQFEDLSKLAEEERQKFEQKLRDSANAEVPQDVQETYRNEGRREMEQRIADLERAHLDRLREVTTQLQTCQTDSENLKKEVTVLRNAENDKEDRTKIVLKAAKSKITELTEERNRARAELNELRNRFDSTDSNQNDSRIQRLEKEKCDLIAERQTERERFTREIDSLTQRVNHLQRQLGLPPASKPSTSSGSSDKSGCDPPTANIKPMSGHSNTQQQSVTVMPWRGQETPFASIRPMAQLRTVAVLPTSQNSGSSSPSTAVLVPPQQQIVHTTGNSSIEVMSSSPTSSHTDYMPATSSASPAIAPIRQVVVPPTQQATIGMSTREDPPSAAESTQDMEPETDTQQPVMQQQQQTVAMVLPRVEQQSSSSQTQNAEQSTSTSVAVVASSQQASSSNTVTTTQAGHKRPRETEGDSSTGGQNDEQPKILPQTKRSRTQLQTPEVFQVGVTESGVEVEYQVPTSSQRDQEDDVVIVVSEDDNDGPDEGDGDVEGEEEGMEADDDGPFEESGDGDGDGYEMEALAYEQEQELAYDDADCPDMVDDSETPGGTDDANNEVEIIDDDDDSEVPNQSGSSSNISVAPEQSGVGGSNGESGRDNSIAGGSQAQTASQSEAISSGSSEGTTGVTQSQATPSMTMFQRSRNVAPLSRQQQSHLLLPHGFEETGDDGIVPSTPTLYVPRRTDSFGEAVSSPHVPSGRFTFSDTSAITITPRGGASSVQSNDGLDDNRGDLSQLDDSGTGRSVPTTPLQVSPQGEQLSMEGNSEVGASGETTEETDQAHDDIPSITVTEAGDPETSSHQDTDSRTAADNCPAEDVAGPSSMGGSGDTTDGQDDTDDVLEVDEGTDGVSSEGEKPQVIEDGEIEESREAEASPSTNTRSRRGIAVARRSSRIGFRTGTRSPHRPTPIIWNESQRGGHNQQEQLPVRGNFQTRHRPRRIRQRPPFGRF